LEPKKSSMSPINSTALKDCNYENAPVFWFALNAQAVGSKATFANAVTRLYYIGHAFSIDDCVFGSNALADDANAGSRRTGCLCGYS